MLYMVNVGGTTYKLLISSDEITGGISKGA